MRYIQNIIIILSAASVLAVSSCSREDCDYDVPVLNYSSFERINTDTFQLTYEFIDCDGNIGLDPEDNDPPFDQDGEYYYNFFVDIFYKEDGEWYLYEFGDEALGLNDRIRRIRESDRNRALEGEIEKYIDESTFDPILDTIRFRAVLVDRDLNESEPADSDEIVISQML